MQWMQGLYPRIPQFHFQWISYIKFIGHVFVSQPQLWLIGYGSCKPDARPWILLCNSVSLATSAPNADRKQILHEGSQNREMCPGAGSQEQGSFCGREGGTFCGSRVARRPIFADRSKCEERQLGLVLAVLPAGGAKQGLPSKDAMVNTKS